MLFVICVLAVVWRFVFCVFACSAVSVIVILLYFWSQYICILTANISKPMSKTSRKENNSQNPIQRKKTCYVNIFVCPGNVILVVF